MKDTIQKIIHVDDLSAEALSLYTNKYSEKQLKTLYEPKGGVFIAESPNVVERALHASYEPLSFLVDETIWQGATKAITDRYKEVPVYVAQSGGMAEITGLPMTRGMLSVMRRKQNADAEKICREASRIAVLYDIVNPTNIGAIVRSAAALSMDAVLFTGACCDPLYRRAIRVSMGTIFQIPWAVVEEDMLSFLHKQGYQTVAMALRKDSYAIDAPELGNIEKMAVILGTEGDGLPQSVMDACDYTVMIPMAHQVDSLNVAAASAVAFWELSKHRRL